jgi:hypothetical protein
MNWKWVLVGILVCAVILWLSNQRRKESLFLDRPKPENLDKTIKNFPEDVRFLISVGNIIFDKLEKVGFAGLTDGEKTFLCVTILRDEVNNGGFDQFYFNDGGEYAVEAVGAFEKIGAANVADIVRRANSAFPNGQPAKDRDARKRELDALTEAQQSTLRQLDLEFYKYGEDVDKLLKQFVESHPNDFPKT